MYVPEVWSGTVDVREVSSMDMLDMAFGQYVNWFANGRKVLRKA